MRLDNFIQTAMNNVLKNPLLSVLRDINFSSILKQSNFIKRDIGVSPYLITLQFLYMFIINKKISTFMKYSNDSFKKDVYYRLLKNEKYNWRKLLLLSSAKLIKRLHILQKNSDTKVLIIDEYIFRFIIHKELNYINDWKTDLYSRAFTFDQIKLFTIYLNKLINTQSRKYIENFINILEKIVLVIDLEQKFRIEYSEKGYITKAINDAIVEKFNGLIDEINSDIEYYEYYNLELKKRNPNIYGKSFQEKIQEARKNLIN
ncbi:hypothetical protein [Aliarcobacter butzleri]|uniref:hypothetical protein n=1 Tax=Aliarcobacter butzleri TaxID=28197 RepID=UPI0021B470EB|nr:hypothetical protein [Aliarcobacter butzleri]MCT7646019.1 hypothetical protein [Aliarcobacter butzleri]